MRGVVKALAVVLMVVAARAGGAGDEAQVNLSFDQVDIRSLVKIVGDMTGRRFVVSSDVVGKVTVVAPGVRQADVYPLFVSILEGAGFSVVEEGGVRRIVKLSEGGLVGGPVVGPGETAPEDGVATRIFRLTHVPASSVRRALEGGGPSKGRVGQIGVVEETNHLIVTDTSAALRRVERLVAEIDQPGLARTMDMVPLEFAGAEEVARQLNLAISEVESRAEALRRRVATPDGGSVLTSAQNATVVAAAHANSLILVGTTSQIDDLRRLVKAMDIDAPAGRTRLNAIFLKYLSAKEAAETLNKLLTLPPATKDSSEPRRRSIAIEASPVNNALLVEGTPGDFEAVKRVVEQLDVLPEQVHIEVVIAELSVDDSFTLGVEMAAIDMPSKVGDTVIQGASLLSEGVSDVMDAAQSGILPNGLSVGVAHGAYLDSAGKIVSGYPGIINIDALKRDGRFEVLSKTSLEAQNNQEASVNIVDDIPLLKSTIQGGSGSSRDVIQNIERVDVGIKLKLTPHIVPGGEVKMELHPSIETVIDEGPSGTTFAPTIAKREAQTTVTVPNGKTIVIAGLTRADKSKVVRKVPILGSIPLLGMLFRHTADATRKTDLLIFVTPRVVSGGETAEAVMEAWRERTGGAAAAEGAAAGDGAAQEGAADGR